MISLDITAEKCTESALRESEERFSKVFQSNPAPIIISEIESGLLLDVNQRWLTMLEYSREEVIGRTAKEIGAWQNPEERECMVRELREKGFLRDYPVLLRAKSGRVRFTLRSTEIIVLNGKEVLVSLIYDDTDRQKTEHTLRESEEKFSLAFDAGPDSININRLEDGLYVMEAKLKDPAFVARMAKFLKATFKGWNDAVKNPAEAAKIVVAADSSGSATEKVQLRQMENVAKLITNAGTPKIGYLEPAAYERTVKVLLTGGSSPVIKKDPGKAAYSHVVWEAAAK